LNPICSKVGSVPKVAKTEEAVKSFQRLKDLKVDGVVGANTYAALEVAIIVYNNPIEIITIRKGSQGRLVSMLQQLLTATGYTVKPHTDFFGNITEIAVRNFQRKNRLLSDGVVGPVTWNALGVSKKANLFNSFDSLVASLSGIGAHCAAIARNAPNTNEATKPVQQLKTSHKGLQFIYTREALQGRSNILHWPGMNSWVTLGPGYDMKERSETEVVRDLMKISVIADVAKKIAKGAGLNGIKAKEFCNSNPNLIILPDKQEFELMKIVVPTFERQVKKRITVDLLQHEFDALVSFAYNHGTVCRRITNPINYGKIATAMKEMKASNTSGGKVNRGLANRRALEIALYTMGNYGKLRIV
jgi:hypothetical protein